MMDKDRFYKSGLIEQYVLGLTTEEENAEVEKYAEAYPEVKQEIREMRSAIESYAQKHAIPPPDNLKDKVMSEVGKDSRPSDYQASSKGGTISRPLFGFALAAVVGLVFLAGLFYRRGIQTENKYDRLLSEYLALEETCDEQHRACTKMEKVFALLRQPDMEIIKLQGTSVAPKASAVVFLDQEGNSVYLDAQDLPPPPPGKQYQIWADVEGEMIDMGMVAQQEQEPQRMRYIKDAESFNITLEPEGGSRKPSVDLLYVKGKV